jgi:hypothetical protein
MSEPEMGAKGKQIYSDARVGSVRTELDLEKLKCPLILKSKPGRKRIKRFLSPVEQLPKEKKKKTQVVGETRSSFKQTSFCGLCRRSGHKCNACPDNQEAVKKPMKKPCCSNCNLPGHKTTQCYTKKPSVDDFNINDI